MARVQTCTIIFYNHTSRRFFPLTNDRNIWKKGKERTFYNMWIKVKVIMQEGGAGQVNSVQVQYTERYIKQTATLCRTTYNIQSTTWSKTYIHYNRKQVTMCIQNKMYDKSGSTRKRNIKKNLITVKAGQPTRMNSRPQYNQQKGGNHCIMQDKEGCTGSGQVKV